MSTTLKFMKVNSLPATYDPSTFYLVRNGNFAETYVTTANGTALSVGNSSMINNLIDAKLNAMKVLVQVADIAERDSQAATATGNAMYLVTNATADTTVTAGAALYFYNKATNTFTKVSEYESLDIVLQWNNIQGRPASSPAALDDAVAKAHTHSNKATLDALGDSGGTLTYGGVPVQGSWITTDW